MASKLTPLEHNVKIVNNDGTPTPYLIQLLQQLYEEKAATDALAAAAVPDTRILTAGAGLTGGGDLTADRVFDVGGGVGLTVTADAVAVNTQAVLNQITTTRGAILYRGASLWSALAPGAAGYVLTTGGAGADPSWAAAAGGGGTAWGSITGTPTTLAGYGITDAAPLSHVGAGGVAEHALVIAAGAAGFMSGADKTKLDGIAAGATANSTDAFLLARANHTGTQGVGTITGLGYFATGTDAANLTGTIAAAQTPAYTGDVSSAAGSLTMTIGAHKVTRGMMVQTAGATILGATAAGDVADLTAAQAKTFLAITAADVSGLGYFATGANAANLTGTLAVAQMPATTGGDVSNTAGTFTLTIGANKVTRAMLAQTAGATILGATAAGNVADLTAAQAKTFLAIVAADVGGLGYFATGTDAANLTGTVAAARIAANSLVLGKLAQITNNRIIGNVSGAVGDPAELTAAQVKTMLAIAVADVSGLGTIATHAVADFVATPASLADQIVVARALGTGVILAQAAAAGNSHTGDLVETTLATITVPANAMGTNGHVIVEAVFSSNSGTNSKTQRIRFGGTQMGSNAGNTQSANFHTRIANRGATGSQVAPAGTGVGTIAAAAATSAIDTTANANITITGQLGNAGDTITLESYQVILYPKA